MDRVELKRVLNLQEVAFQLVSWINQQLRHQATRCRLGDVREIQHAHACREWLARLSDELPSSLRVDDSDLPTLAHLFSALLRTSFECELPTMHVMPRSEGRNSKSASVARYCSALALLAKAEGLTVSRTQIVQLARDHEPAADLVLWSYAMELVRRTKSEHPGRGSLFAWKLLEHKSRRGLTIGTVWSARTRLLKALRG